MGRFLNGYLRKRQQLKFILYVFSQNKAVIELMFAAYSGDVSALRR